MGGIMSIHIFPHILDPEKEMENLFNETQPNLLNTIFDDFQKLQVHKYKTIFIPFSFLIVNTCLSVQHISMVYTYICAYTYLCAQEEISLLLFGIRIRTLIYKL